MQQYIFLASLSLGGAEKIVMEHLAVSRFMRSTLIVLYNKEHEYAVPKGVNLLRLNGKMTNGALLFKQIAFEKEVLIAHLISDKALAYLFDFNLHLSLVFHNDKLGWKNSKHYFNHPNISSLIVVSQHIKRQLSHLTSKPIIVIKHRLALPRVAKRNIREILDIDAKTKVIGMVGRIAPQKDYLYALELLKETSFVLMIVGGFEKSNESYYRELIKKIVHLKMQKRVFLVGFRENVHDYMAIFDIGLNTSVYEGLSIATQEMLSYDIPVYVADNLGQQEILDLNHNLHFFNKSVSHIEFSFLSNKMNNLNRNHKIFKNSLSQWNLLGKVHTQLEEDETLYITQNLGLGGAQRSLTNLLLELGKPLVVLNKSNYTAFISELYSQNAQVKYLDKEDVFVICALLFQEISSYKKIVFWNVDAKVKLLVSKFFPQKYLVDVSPGNYMFEELKMEEAFSLAIDYDAEDYFTSLNKIVSKYNFFDENFSYKELIVEKTEIIPNGIPFPKNIKSSYLFQGKVLVLGRIASSKFIFEILQAFKCFPKFSLSLVGSVHKKEEQYFKDRVEPYFNKQIKLLAPIHDTQNLMLNYDFIIILGVNQGSPNTVLEALSVGLPIISNDSGGTKSMLKNSGILMKDISVEDIESSIFEMVNNYSYYVKRSEERQKKVIDDFSMEKFRTAYAEL